MTALLLEQTLCHYIRRNITLFEPLPTYRSLDHRIDHLYGVAKHIADYVQAHYTESFFLDHMADILKYNKNYLCKIFKQATNLPSSTMSTIKD